MQNVSFKGKCTMYIDDIFGVSKHELSEFNVETTRYAQYVDALKLTYKGKGQRKLRGCYKTYKPFVVVVEGHNKPDVDDGYEVVSNNNGVTVKKSKYSSFAQEYTDDANKFIEQMLSDPSVKCIFDYRNKTPSTVDYTKPYTV